MGSGKNLSPSLHYELQAGHPSLVVAGVDEVGRGCLAGPVVACAVVLPSLKKNSPLPDWISEVGDSKLLSPEVREKLYPLIQSWVRSHSLGMASVVEIDQINIHHASHLAMDRAVRGLGLDVKHVLVDGKFIPRQFSPPLKATAIIKGDQKSLAIACSSILAKVWRDRLMDELERVHPGYGLAANKGYPTPAHKNALRKIGASPIHRRSFSPVSECLGAKSQTRTSQSDQIPLL